MADDGKEQSRNAWPLPKFRFEVRWDAAVMSFQEASGLDIEAQPIKYRVGDNKAFSGVKMPGIKKYSAITMKKGVFKSGYRFWDWFNEIKTNTVKRKPITIRLLDEGGRPTMMWTLANAWPTKVSGPALNAEGNEVSMESIEIAHEGITTTNS